MQNISWFLAANERIYRGDWAFAKAKHFFALDPHGRSNGVQRGRPATRRAGDGGHQEEFEHPANRQDSDRLSLQCACESRPPLSAVLLPRGVGGRLKQRVGVVYISL